MADADVEYLGCTPAVTAAGTNVLVTVDTGLTRAVFITPTVNQISYDVVDYLENTNQWTGRFSGERAVFLPKGTKVNFIASAQMALLVYLRNVVLPAE